MVSADSLKQSQDVQIVKSYLATCEQPVQSLLSLHVSVMAQFILNVQNGPLPRELNGIYLVNVSVVKSRGSLKY